MKAAAGLVVGILFAAAGALFLNLAMANSALPWWGSNWILAGALYLIAVIVAMTAPTAASALRRLLAASGALLCADAVLILLLGTAPLSNGVVGISGSANIAVLFLVGFALLAVVLFSNRMRR